MVKMLSLKKSKAQLVMSDFLMGVVVLLSIIMLSALIWNKTIDNLRIKERRNDMENLALSISDHLVRDFGIPPDWNTTTVMAIGLAEEDNVLDPDKVSYFTSLENDKAKTLLAIRNYNFIYRLRNTNENILLEYGDVPSNAEEVVIVRRIVLFEGQNRMMDFGLWI